MLAQPIPKPIIGRINKPSLFIKGNNTNPMPDNNKAPMCTRFAPALFAAYANKKATQKVTILYVPLSVPVNNCAELKPEDFGSDVFKWFLPHKA